MAREIEVPPYTDTVVPGTGLTVWHDLDEESFVHVEDDGRVRLCGGPDWRIRVNPAAGAPPELVEAARDVDRAWDRMVVERVSTGVDEVARAVRRLTETTPDEQ